MDGWPSAQTIRKSRVASYCTASAALRGLWFRGLPAAAAMSVAIALSSCSKPLSPAVHARAAGGEPSRGAALIRYYGCGSCHSIPGIAGADALVGPPLDHFSKRIYVAGVLRNTPDNLILWIRNPQKIVPGNVMPAMGIDRRDARDIAAYLYTLD